MESLEDIQTRHRKEQKDLQARVTQKKKGASKKTRKGVNSECEDLERNLREKHEQELAALRGDVVPDIDDVPELDDSTVAEPATGESSVTEALEKTSISGAGEEHNGEPKKRNRAKERLARRAAEQEAAVDEAKREAANLPDPKAIEHAKMAKAITAQGLVEKLIRPDGHCLFSAVADQLEQVDIPLGANSSDDQRYQVVRDAAAKYMESHPDEFVAWLEEPLEQYVEKIRDQAEWGGHLELMALARTYKIEICVLQNGEIQKIEPGEGIDGLDSIWLSYYRHGFGLGEHYNSLRKSP